jgi:hypothetical protein
MEITRFKAPTFKVGRYTLNEYELRILQIEVALAEKPPGIKVRDMEGTVAYIRRNGCLSNSLKGTEIAGALSLRLLGVLNKGE